MAWLVDGGQQSATTAFQLLTPAGPVTSPNIMLVRELPTDDEMYRAFMTRDTSYEGIFITGVRTTGIFCRPSCPAKKPARENIEFFGTPREALAHGYRPCRRCHPLEPSGQTPEIIRELLRELDGDPGLRLRDGDLRGRGIDPATVRRWFNANHGMTFQAYQRGLRLSRALGTLARGGEIAQTAFEHGYDSLSGFQDAIRMITGRSVSASRDAAVVHLQQILTPLGPMLAGSTSEGICLLEFTDRRMLPTQIDRLERRLGCVFMPGNTEFGDQVEQELKEYFAGTRREFTAPLVVPGSEFQRRVWEMLREIPYGETRSYADQARAIGIPAAVRAVARANGDNRIAIIIPCHRVIGSDGTLTGYGGGIWRKQYLLDLERGSMGNRN